MSRTIRSRAAAGMSARGSITQYTSRWFSTLTRTRHVRRALSPFAALALLVAIACSDDPSTGPETIPVASVTVTPATHSLVVGSTTTLAATLADANDRPISGRAVAWTSDRPDVATVTTTGTVTAVAPGTATIDAASEGKHGTAIVTVTRVSVARIDIAPQTLSLVEGENGNLTASAKDAAGNTLEDRAIQWRSRDATVATIDATGLVMAVQAGTTAITAESEGKSASIELTVRAVPLANVAVSALPGLLETGDQPSLTATLTDASGRVLQGRGITWTTSDAAIATVSATGIVSARGVGPVTITATSEGKSASTTALNGEIVEDIYAVDRIGTNMKRLTTAPGVDNAPPWSPVPGSNLIAYHRLDPENGSDIWVMNADGSNARNLTLDQPRELMRGDPEWSPDGQWIAFTQSRSTAGPGRGSIWIMRGDGSDKRQVTLHPGNGFDLNPSWSPDGQRIAFRRGGIAIVTVATGEVTYLDLPGTEMQPSWSPDGRHIAFAWTPSEPGSGVWQLYTVRPDGTGMRLRTTNPAWGGGVSPAWIPTQR